MWIKDLVSSNRSFIKGALEATGSSVTFVPFDKGHAVPLAVEQEFLLAHP